MDGRKNIPPPLPSRAAKPNKKKARIQHSNTSQRSDSRYDGSSYGYSDLELETIPSPRTPTSPHRYYGSSFPKRQTGPSNYPNAASTRSVDAKNIFYPEQDIISGYNSDSYRSDGNISQEEVLDIAAADIPPPLPGQKKPKKKIFGLEDRLYANAPRLDSETAEKYLNEMQSSDGPITSFVPIMHDHLLIINLDESLDNESSLLVDEQKSKVKSNRNSELLKGIGMVRSSRWYRQVSTAMNDLSRENKVLADIFINGPQCIQSFDEYDNILKEKSSFSGHSGEKNPYHLIHHAHTILSRMIAGARSGAKDSENGNPRMHSIIFYNIYSNSSDPELKMDSAYYSDLFVRYVLSQVSGPKNLCTVLSLPSAIDFGAMENKNQNISEKVGYTYLAGYSLLSLLGTYRSASNNRQTVESGWLGGIHAALELEEKLPYTSDIDTTSAALNPGRYFCISNLELKPTALNKNGLLDSNLWVILEVIATLAINRPGELSSSSESPNLKTNSVISTQTANSEMVTENVDVFSAVNARRLRISKKELRNAAKRSHFIHNFQQKLSSNHKKSFFKSKSSNTMSVEKAQQIWVEFLNSLRYSGISDAEIRQIIQILWAIISLGSVEITSNFGLYVSLDKGAMTLVEKLLGLDSSDVEDEEESNRFSRFSFAAISSQTKLKRVIVQRTACTKSNFLFTKFLDAEQAKKARNDLAATIYSNLVDWLADRINNQLSTVCNLRMKTTDERKKFFINTVQVPEQVTSISGKIDLGIDAFLKNYAAEKLRLVIPQFSDNISLVNEDFDVIDMMMDSDHSSLRKIVENFQKSIETSSFKWFDVDYSIENQIISHWSGYHQGKRDMRIQPPSLDDKILNNSVDNLRKVDDLTYAFSIKHFSGFSAYDFHIADFIVSNRSIGHVEADVADLLRKAKSRNMVFRKMFTGSLLPNSDLNADLAVEVNTSQKNWLVDGQNSFEGIEKYGAMGKFRFLIENLIQKISQSKSKDFVLCIGGKKKDVLRQFESLKIGALCNFDESINSSKQTGAQGTIALSNQPTVKEANEKFMLVDVSVFIPRYQSIWEKRLKCRDNSELVLHICGGASLVENRDYFMLNSECVAIRKKAWLFLEMCLLKNQEELLQKVVELKHKSGYLVFSNDSLQSSDSYTLRNSSYSALKSQSVENIDFDNEDYKNEDNWVSGGVDLEGESTFRRFWVRFCYLTTFLIPEFLLYKVGGMATAEKRLAFREKLTICLLILILNVSILGALSFFEYFICTDTFRWDARYSSLNYFNFNFLNEEKGKSLIRRKGEVFDINSARKSLSPSEWEEAKKWIGKDVTEYPISNHLSFQKCPTLQNSRIENLRKKEFNPVTTEITTNIPDIMKDPRLYTHKIGGYLYSMNELIFYKSFEVGGLWVRIGGDLYNLTEYFSFSYAGFFSPLAEKVFQDFGGKEIPAYVVSQLEPGALECLNEVFRIGGLDQTTNPDCVIVSEISFALLAVVLGIMFVKFVCAFRIGWFSTPSKDRLDKYIFLFMPCYTENRESLETTINSLVETEYDDEKKVLFIVADGMVMGNGNHEPTPQILLDLLNLSPDPTNPPPTYPYVSLAQGKKALNYGQIFSGFYERNGHRVPVVVVVKVGQASERNKPGNRGKRDSQLILMRFLNKVYHRKAMSPLEMELFYTLNHVLKADPNLFEYTLMVDSDTKVDKFSLNELALRLASDRKSMGVTGETKVNNKYTSPTTAIQVYEYFQNHHLSKAFESLFGTVTCMPGCFSMWKIKDSVRDLPLLISSDIIYSYGVQEVETLHDKNLLLLGEDRYLTTLMLKTYPGFKTKYTPKAVCYTDVPDSLGVLMSQRRRWINSTLHNLTELLFVKGLCGCCLFGMRFVVLFDVISTLVLPGATLYFIYLLFLLVTSIIPPFNAIIATSIIYGTHILIIFGSGSLNQLFWFVINVLAMGIFNFLLPIYSFWKLDDFSWGSTRVTTNDAIKKSRSKSRLLGGSGLKFDDEEYLDESVLKAVPTKKWDIAQLEWRNASKREERSSQPLSRIPDTNGEIYKSSFTPASFESNGSYLHRRPSRRTSLASSPRIISPLN